MGVTRWNSKEKENADLAQAPENEVRIDPVEVMDISAQAMEEEVVEMTEDSVVDIDADDAGNPQLVVEYVNDIYSYLRHLETVQCVEADYLAGQTEIQPKMRAVLIDWLVGVHLQFHLLQETLYTTVAILDRFLQVEVGSVSRNKLQLVGVAAMLVAAKYEEVYSPEIKDFVYITDEAYTEKDILRMEIRILATLNFDLGRPLPIHFLRRASKAGGVEATTHTLAKYALEEIRPTIERLAAILINAPSAKLATVYQKYSNKKFMKIARIPVLEDPSLRKIAKGLSLRM